MLIIVIISLFRISWSVIGGMRIENRDIIEIQSCELWHVKHVKHKLISFELALQDASIFSCEYPITFFQVIHPLTFVSTAISIVENTKAMSLPVEPLAFISISELLLFTFLLNPQMTSKPVLLIF